MNTYKVLDSSWMKYLLFVCIAFIYSSCTTNQYFTYYDGIYEEPVHVPNTVFSEEMNRVNGLDAINIDNNAPYLNTNTSNDINPNANYQDYINNTANNNPNVNVYVDNNIDPFWNNGWNDPYWGSFNRWNSFHWNRGWGNRWNSFGWNNSYWGNNFYDPFFNNWGWNHPYYGFNQWHGFNNWYLFGAYPWLSRRGNNISSVRSSRNQTYRNNSNSYRQNRTTSNSRYYNSNNNRNSSNNNNSYRRSSSQNSSQTQARTYTPKTSTSNYKSSSSSSSGSSSSSRGSSYRSNSNSYRRR